MPLSATLPHPQASIHLRTVPHAQHLIPTAKAQPHKRPSRQPIRAPAFDRLIPKAQDNKRRAPQKVRTQRLVNLLYAGVV